MDRLAAALERARNEGSLGRPGAPHLPAPGAARTREVAASAAALARHHVGRGDQRDALADVFKHLRTQVLQRMQDAGWQTLGVTSPHAGEGRTTTAINLALHVALDVDWTAILVDANLETPGLTRAFGLPELPGLGDYLVHGAALEDLLVRTDVSRCVLLPAGARPPRASEMLGSARMRSLVEELKRRYANRLVIIDMPPVLDSPAGAAMLPCVDAVLLVVEDARTWGEDAQRTSQLIGPARLLGTVLNKSRAEG